MSELYRKGDGKCEHPGCMNDRKLFSTHCPDRQAQGVHAIRFGAGHNMARAGTPLDFRKWEPRAEPYRDPADLDPIDENLEDTARDLIAAADALVQLLEAYADDLAAGGRVPSGEWDPDCASLEEEWHRITATANHYRAQRKIWEA